VRRGRFVFLDIALVQTPQIVAKPLVGRATFRPPRLHQLFYGQSRGNDKIPRAFKED